MIGTHVKTPKRDKEITPKIEELLNKREEARRQKNWKLADEIRDKLIKMGIEVKDVKIK